ncbi:MAG: YfiT family bacillithiol transferase [Gemmatimonadaceae bacterium]
MPVTNPHFPIGRYNEPATVTPAQRTAWMDDVAGTPAAMRAALSGLSPAQLDTPYRDGGWTLRQVVHHVPDSHMNAYMRFKLALTEDVPVIKPYDQAGWAELPDSAATPIEISLTLLEALHARWVRLMRAMSPMDFARSFRHPEHDRIFTLESTLGLYAWHGRHHVAHITALRERNGW